MDSPESSPSTLACDTQWSIFHLATVLSPEPLKFLMGSFKRNPPPLASETFTCIYSVLLSHAARIKNTQGFSTKQKNVKKKKNPKPSKNKNPIVLSCQTLRNSSICNYSALTSFPKAAVGSCPGCATFSAPEVQFLSCPQH